MQKLTQLEADAVQLLRRLCSDRGVIRGAKTGDPRELFNDLAERHNLEPIDAHSWNDGVVRFTAMKPLDILEAAR